MLFRSLGLVAIGPRAWQRYETAKTPRFYWDWKKYRKNVPFTPALSLLFQLDEALKYINEDGMDKIFARRAAVAQRIRSLVERSGMEVYAKRPGNGITGVIPPAGFDIEGLTRRMESEFGIQIGDGQGRIKSTTFRIGHVGYITDADLDYFTQCFEACLKK